MSVQANPPSAAAKAPPRRGFAIRWRIALWLLAAGVLVVTAIASIAIGSRDIAPDVIWTVLTGGSATAEDTAAILDLRLPRTVVALACGAALGMAGAIIQAVTRNPLADPGILGVTSGAAFAVAIAVAVLGINAPQQYIWFAFAGAFLATVAVYLIGATGRSGNPVRLLLAGVALSAVLSGVVSGMRLTEPKAFNAMRVWEVGSLQDRDWDAVTPVLPFLAVGLVIAVMLGRGLNAVALGDDLAVALGTKPNRTRVLAVIAITLLAGGATAIAGPIAFIGLMVPHLARWITGPDQRWIVAFTLLLAPTLLLIADIIGRVVVRPAELQAGLVTAFLGGPVLIFLIRRYRMSRL